MKHNLLRASAFRYFALGAGLFMLASCGANTDGTAAIPPAQNAPQVRALPDRAHPAGVMTAFIPTLGSGGNGAVMTELKKHGGQLREPSARYDVFDTESTADLKTIKQNILASLERDRSVLIDSDGTSESRARAAQITYESIGASLPDVGTVVIRKAPEEHGGGFALIPIYSKADVAEQIAQGKISNSGELNNTVENFFFEPPESIQK